MSATERHVSLLSVAGFSVPVSMEYGSTDYYIIAFHHCHFDNVHTLSTMFIFLISGLMLSSNDDYL